MKWDQVHKHTGCDRKGPNNCQNFPIFRLSVRATTNKYGLNSIDQYPCITPAPLYNVTQLWPVRLHLMGPASSLSGSWQSVSSPAVPVANKIRPVHWRREGWTHRQEIIVLGCCGSYHSLFHNLQQCYICGSDQFKHGGIHQKSQLISHRSTVIVRTINLPPLPSSLHVLPLVIPAL
jgi:hypothetical protein